MNRILLFALCALLCSCSQNKEKEAETALFEQIRQDYVEMKKYHSTILEEKDRTVDVYVRKGEKITDMTVLSEESNCVSVVFDNYRRVYNIFLQKGEKIKGWGLKEIKTDKHVIRVNMVRE